MASLRRVVVTGATGKQGGAFIEALLAKPKQSFKIYAVTRDPKSKSARALAAHPNVRVVQGDFDNPKDIFAQVQDPWGLFSMTTPVVGKKGAAEIEEQQGKSMVDAALHAGVKHIVYTSVDRGIDSDNNDTPVPHFRSKKHVEDHIKAQATGKSLSWTIIRPVAFFDNLTDDFIGKVFFAVWRQNGMGTKLQMIGSKDVGRIAAEAMLNAETEEYRNRSLTIAGDVLSPAEAAIVFKRATGRDIPSTLGIFATLTKWAIPDELGKMFQWFKDEGFSADIPALKANYPFMKSFEEWIVQESAWKRSVTK